MYNQVKLEKYNDKIEAVFGEMIKINYLYFITTVAPFFLANSFPPIEMAEKLRE